MKPVRLFLYFLAGLMVLAVTAVAVAFTSRFQTWATRKALAGQPSLHASVGRVSAGLGRVELESVHAEPDGAIFNLPALSAELPLLSAGLSEKVTVSRLVAKGWTLDLSRGKSSALGTSPLSAPPASAPALTSGEKRKSATTGNGFLSSANAADAAATATVNAFQGVFSQLKLPVDLSLDGVELEGDVLLPPAPDASVARAHVRMVGGGLAAGREGRFTLDLEVTFTGEKVSVTALTAHSTFIAAMDTPRTFTRIELETAASAKGEKFPGGLKLVATIGATSAPLLENYTAVLVLEGQEVVAVHADFPRGSNSLTGTWKLNARTADLAPFTLGRALPEINAVGEGKFSADSAFEEIRASGQLDATAAQLAVIKPELSELGSLKINAEFDLAQHGRALRIDRLTAQVNGSKPVVSVQSLQPFEFNASTGELKVAEPARELLALNFQGVPLAWVQPFVKGYALTGGDLRGEFSATASNGGLAVRSRTPLTVAGFSLSSGAGGFVREVDLSLGLTADYSPQGWQVELAPLSLGNSGAPLLTLTAKAGQLAGKNQPFKATGRWSANLAALLLQPISGGKVGLTQGEASGEFVATIAAKQELQAAFVFKQLVADPALTKATLPVITAELRADVDSTGKINFSVPVLFERDGRKSDLTLAGTAMPGAPTTVLDVRATSALLIVDDVQVLAGLAPARTSPLAEGSTTLTTKPVPDEKPFWAGLSGQFALALKKVVYSEKFEVNDVAGTLRLEEGALKFDGVRAGFGTDSALKFNGGVTFTPAAAEPYALKAEFALNNFDSAPLFRALDPTKAPAVEGRFNVISHLAGNAPNADQLAERARGDFEVTSKSGIFRGLAVDVTDSLKQTPSMISGLLSNFGALFGMKKESVQDATEYLDARAKDAVELTNLVKEISYDQISVVAKRDEKLNILLKEFSLISPEVRLRGTGQITYVEGVSLVAQPLDLRVQLGARGKVEAQMNKLGLLDAKPDELGYTTLTESVRIGGTLENRDNTNFRKILVDAAIKKAKGWLREHVGDLGGLLGR